MAVNGRTMNWLWKCKNSATYRFDKNHIVCETGMTVAGAVWITIGCSVAALILIAIVLIIILLKKNKASVAK